MGDDVLQLGRFLGLIFICAHDLYEDPNLKKGTFHKNDLTEGNHEYNTIAKQIHLLAHMVRVAIFVMHNV